MEGNTSLQQLWIVNSGSIGVTHTSMCSYNRSMAASQAKCVFWLLTALKDNLFPERIWNVLFIIQKWRLNSYEKKMWEQSTQNNLLYWLNYYVWNSSHNITDITTEIVQATVIQHPPF